MTMQLNALPTCQQAFTPLMSRRPIVPHELHTFAKTLQHETAAGLLNKPDQIRGVLSILHIQSAIIRQCCGCIGEAYRFHDNRRAADYFSFICGNAKQVLMPAGAFPAQAPGDNQMQFRPSHVTPAGVLQDPEPLVPAQLAHEYPVGCMWMHASMPRLPDPSSRQHEVGGMPDSDLRRKSSGGDMIIQFSLS